MIRYIADSLHWAKALERYSSGKFAEARSELERIRGARMHYSEYLALLATVNIVLMNEGVAREMLISAINDKNPRKPEYREYVDLYCKYYISVLDGDEGGQNKFLQDALKVSAPPIIRQWLPLS